MKTKRQKNATQPGNRPFRLPKSPFKSPAVKLADVSNQLLGQAKETRGFAQLDIFSHWEAIVGQGLVHVTSPDRLEWPRRPSLDQWQGQDNQTADKGAVLHLNVDGPIAIEVQHMIPQIIQRINGYFGFYAVSAIRLKQAPVSSSGGARLSSSFDGKNRRNQLGMKSVEIDDSELDKIENEKLKNALKRLGSPGE